MDFHLCSIKSYKVYQKELECGGMNGVMGQAVRWRQRLAIRQLVLIIIGTNRINQKLSVLCGSSQRNVEATQHGCAASRTCYFASSMVLVIEVFGVSSR